MDLHDMGLQDMDLQDMDPRDMEDHLEWLEETGQINTNTNSDYYRTIVGDGSSTGLETPFLINFIHTPQGFSPHDTSQSMMKLRSLERQDFDFEQDFKEFERKYQQESGVNLTWINVAGTGNCLFNALHGANSGKKVGAYRDVGEAKGLRSELIGMIGNFDDIVKYYKRDTEVGLNEITGQNVFLPPDTELRLKLIDELKLNRTVVPLDDAPDESLIFLYKELMQTDGIYGGEIEIQLAAVKYDRPIIVIRGDELTTGSHSGEGGNTSKMIYRNKPDGDDIWQYMLTHGEDDCLTKISDLPPPIILGLIGKNHYIYALYTLSDWPRGKEASATKAVTRRPTGLSATADVAVEAVMAELPHGEGMDTSCSGKLCGDPRTFMDKPILATFNPLKMLAFQTVGAHAKTTEKIASGEEDVSGQIGTEQVSSGPGFGVDSEAGETVDGAGEAGDSSNADAMADIADLDLGDSDDEDEDEDDLLAGLDDLEGMSGFSDTSQDEDGVGMFRYSIDDEIELARAAEQKERSERDKRIEDYRKGQQIKSDQILAEKIMQEQNTRPSNILSDTYINMESIFSNDQERYDQEIYDQKEPKKGGSKRRRPKRRKTQKRTNKRKTTKKKKKTRKKKKRSTKRKRR